MLHDVHTVRHHSSCAAMGVEVTALLLLPTELTPGRTYAVAGLASGELVLADVGRSRGEVLRRWSHLAPHAPVPTPARSAPAPASDSDSASDSGSGLASGLEGLSFGLAVTCVAADLASGTLFTADEEGGLCAWHVARLLETHGDGGGGGKGDADSTTSCQEADGGGSGGGGGRGVYERALSCRYEAHGEGVSVLCVISEAELRRTELRRSSERRAVPRTRSHPCTPVAPPLHPLTASPLRASFPRALFRQVLRAAHGVARRRHRRVGGRW